MKDRYIVQRPHFVTQVHCVSYLLKYKTICWRNSHTFLFFIFFFLKNDCSGFVKLTFAICRIVLKVNIIRGGSRADATSRMECFVIILNG